MYIIKTKMDYSIKPFDTKKKTKKWALEDLYGEEPFFSQYLFGLPGSGKSTTAGRQIEWLLNVDPKNTRLYIFSGSLATETNGVYNQILDFARKKRIPCESFDSICEKTHVPTLLNPDRTIGHSQLRPINDQFKKEYEKEDPNKTKPPEKSMYGHIKITYIPLEKPKSEKQEPKHNIFLFDDLANELGDPSLEELLRMRRHWHSTIFVASQDLKDLPKSLRSLISHFVLYKNMPPERYEDAFDAIRITIPKDRFFDLYKEYTKDGEINKNTGKRTPNFVYWNTKTGELKQNFDKNISLN